MNVFRTQQYVCKVCGYNIIGYFPNRCPFCGAIKDNFITAEFCSKFYKVKIHKITKNIFSLTSSPKLGLEHVAYCLNTQNKRIWVDCPSIFQDNLERMDKILFTHNHFLGASNLYRSYYTVFVWIHKSDADDILTRNYSFDKKFLEDFELDGIEAFHIGGHTTGFTFYIFDNVLFICDYVFFKNGTMSFNPYGPRNATTTGALKLRKLIETRNLIKVCGYNYSVDFSYWDEKFDKLLANI